jgi:hypothetical protein
LVSPKFGSTTARRCWYRGVSRKAHLLFLQSMIGVQSIISKLDVFTPDGSHQDERSTSPQLFVDY